MSSAVQRAKRREEVDHAYGEVARAASWGAFKYGLYGASAVTIGHFTWPAFRRQTLPFKVFLIVGCVCTGLVFYGEEKLLVREREARLTEGRIRREARIDLARRGIVGTESEIAKWKEERAARLQEEQARRVGSSTPSS